MKVALFSDIHGHFRPLLHCLRCWQLAHGEPLDYALVAGDLNVFPFPSQLDRAVLRHSASKPEELGFSRYFTEPTEEAAQYFAPVEGLGELSAVRAPVLFVPGNHEDAAFIRSRETWRPAAGAPENTFPIDCFEAFHCIRDGEVAVLTGADGSVLRVGGLWGIEGGRRRSAFEVNPKAADRLRYLSGGCDLLLTHDCADGWFPGLRGSITIGNILRSLRPFLHVFGHVHPIDGQHEYTAEGEPTRSWIFHDLVLHPGNKRGLEGTMGILQWDGQMGRVELVQDSWLTAMRFSTWQSLLPVSPT